MNNSNLLDDRNTELGFDSLDGFSSSDDLDNSFDSFNFDDEELDGIDFDSLEGDTDETDDDSGGSIDNEFDAEDLFNDESGFGEDTEDDDSLEEDVESSADLGEDVAFGTDSIFGEDDTPSDGFNFDTLGDDPDPSDVIDSLANSAGDILDSSSNLDDLSDYEHLNDPMGSVSDDELPDVPEESDSDFTGDAFLDGLEINEPENIDEDDVNMSDGAIVDADDLLDDDDGTASFDGISSDFINETGGVKVQDTSDDNENGFEIKYINIENVLIPNRIRKADSENSLTQSIRNTGLLQPLTVAPTMTDGNFVLLDGFRRIQACAKSGMKRVPCVVNNKVSTPEIPLIEAMYNHNRNYNIKEKIAYIDYLEKEKGIMQPTMIEYLLQMNNGDYSKLKDILSDNDPDIVEKLYDGTYDIATAFKKLEQRRKKESAEEKENKKAAIVYGDKEASGINQIEGTGEESSSEPMSDADMQQLAMSIENLDEEIEDKSLNEMVDEDNSMAEYAPHKQEVGNREYIDPAIRKAVMARDNFTCKACKSGGESLVDTLDLHHVIPVWLGGVDSVDNSVMLCVACHRMVHLYSTGDLTIQPTLLKEGGFDELDDKQRARFRDKIAKYDTLSADRQDLYGSAEKYEEEQMRTLYLDEQARFKRIVYLGSQIRKRAVEQGKDREQLRKEHPNTGIGRRKPGKDAPQEHG